jgi:hypothetical protein
MNVGYSEEAKEALVQTIAKCLVEGVEERAYAVAKELVERAEFLQASIHVNFRVRDLRKLLDKLDAALAYHAEWSMEEVKA